MARVVLDVQEPANRLTLKAMLESEGHAVVDADPEVIFCDDIPRAVELARERPVLLLISPGEVREAVAAMKNGVYGYVLAPFVPGEAGIMVQRASNHPLQAGEEPLVPLEEAEMRYILQALRRCKGNQAETARVLGIGRNTLWRKLRKTAEPVERPDPDAAEPL